MRYLIVVLALLIASSDRAVAQSKDAASIEEVRRADRAWGEVFTACQVDAMARMTTDDFVYILSSGVVDTKASLLNTVKNCTAGLMKTEPVTIRIYGPAAFVHGDMTLTGKGQRDDQAARNVYSRVWVKRDGAWVLVSHQSTRVQAPH